MRPNLSHLPGNDGLPFLGQTLAFLKNPRMMAMARHERYGAVSTLTIAGNRGVLLLGPDANEFVTLDREKLFSSREAYEPFLKDIFPDAIGLFDFDEHARQRRIMQSAFKREALHDYFTVVQQGIHKTIGDWKITTPFLLEHAIKLMLFQQAAKLFMGESQADDAEAMIADYTSAAAGTLAIVRLMIPGTTFWRSVRSSLRLRTKLREKIAGKRLNPGRDLFSHLCFAQSDDGEKFNDEQIVRHMLGLMSAAHETTSSVINTMAYALAKYPEVQEKLCRELFANNRNELTWADLDELPYTEQVINECLRLWGPSHTMPRKLLRDVEFKGFRIPAGVMVFISPAFVHYMAQFWKKPDQFDPERFAEERREHRQHRFLFMPFGGGAHKCIGMHLAQIQLKVFFFQLLHRYKINLIKPDYELKLKNVPVPEPIDGLPLMLSKRM